MKKEKSTYTAVFCYYRFYFKHTQKNIFNKEMYFKNIKNQNGEVIRESLSILEEDIPKSLRSISTGDVIEFKADPDFIDIDKSSIRIKSEII